MDLSQLTKDFHFNWESFDIIVGGKSSIDAQRYLSHFDGKKSADKFLAGYGFNITDPIQAAELFGNFQEAIQFIKRYFLKDGNDEGLNVKIPNVFYSITDVSKLLLIATQKISGETSKEEAIWASVILKVMHTILHTDKDLRYRYFTTIQTQIFDRFYRFLQRDENNKLFLESEDGEFKIPIVEFETKSKKTRESTIIKLLHKKENVAEELFDRIGIRIVAKNKIDVLRVIDFLVQNYLIIANNIKPSRSQNTLFDMVKLEQNYDEFVEKRLSQIDESMVAEELEVIAKNSLFKPIKSQNNEHSSIDYRAIHFTCRQLIKYKSPFVKSFSDIKDLAKKEDSELAKKILSLDTSFVSQDVRFFYPYEVQITDLESHQENTVGEASHLEYKKSQLQSAMKRLFKPLIDLKKLDVD